MITRLTTQSIQNQSIPKLVKKTKSLTLASTVARTIVAMSMFGLMMHSQLAQASTLYPSTDADNTTQVFYVGNNWDGTVTVIRPDGDFGQIGTINMVPDREERIKEISKTVLQLGAFHYIRKTAGEGHDQLVDDMYSTPDGKSIVASRPSFADVVSIDIATGQINWRFPVKGLRSDHMAVAPDGKSVAVSSSTGNIVHIVDMQTGKELGNFETGDKPHENIYFADGTKILNSSIGNVQTSFDAKWQDFTKGDRRLTIADVNDGYKVSKIIDMRDAFDAFGREDLSDAVRPAVLSKDESKLYGQVSFFNGLFEYDMTSDTVTRIVELPSSDTIPKNRKDYVNDSRHHGLSISPAGDKLCVAGTMDDYVTIVDTKTLAYSVPVSAKKPYWATFTPDGKNCLVSESAGDSVTVINFATGKKVITVPVGNHPQRVRIGYIQKSWVDSKK